MYSDMKQGVNVNLSIDTKEFPSGVYLIKFRAGSTIKVRKIVKE